MPTVLIPQKDAMPNVIEYRQRAKEFAELARESHELYAKETLMELAEEFRTAADQLERDQGAPTKHGAGKF